jgi:WD40 repeat protein
VAFSEPFLPSPDHIHVPGLLPTCQADPLPIERAPSVRRQSTTCPWFLGCLTAIASVVLIAAAPPSPCPVELERLIQQLGSDDFTRREAASKRLQDIGEPALPALRKALTSDDPEVFNRARRILTLFENRPRLRLTGHHPLAVSSVSVSPDGKRLLTSSWDRTLRLWDAVTGKQLRVFEGHTLWINAAALSPDGKYALSGSADRTVRLWDATTGKQVHQMTGHTGIVYSVAFGPEGKAISGAGDGTMRLWDLRTGKCASVFRAHTHHIDKVAYSHQARIAATDCWPRPIRLWDLETGKEVASRFSTGLHLLCFSGDGKQLLASDHWKRLCILDVGTGKILKSINVGALYGAFSPNGKRIIAGDYAGTVRLWDAATGKKLRQYDLHKGEVGSAAFFPDGKGIAISSKDGTASIWRLPP